ncbi:hypothetical protein PR001_g11509 [Phytophthora rubi]|uniref:Uncharacterized protein n=1 Tax=Phytophthora rubi TaxID=129364 RepID=A0A6A3LZ25_9STRA|nr:hypothetical protein PR002_g11723 [Phytophthora rubi]KAE9029449.1 hypothetical protein PR001_g11509 [Phytophthora rubi]
MFAENFLSSSGGEDAVLTGNLKPDVLCEMPASGWEDVDELDTYDYMMAPFEPVRNTHSYPWLRQGYSGPTPEALRNPDSPIALFFFSTVAACGALLKRVQPRNGFVARRQSVQTLPNQAATQHSGSIAWGPS